MADCFCECDTLLVCKCLHFRLHVVLQFRLGNSTNGGILRHHRDILQIVQLTENAELCELVDSGKENEPQIRVKALYRAVEIPHYLPESRQLAFVVHYVQKRRVIFVNDDYGLLAGLLEGGFHQEFQSRVYIDFIHIRKLSINGLIPFQFISEGAYQLLLIQMLGSGHVEMKNRMLSPFLLYLTSFQPLEKFTPSLEIAVQCRRQQRLAEPARTIQENVFVLIRNVIDITRLVNV